MKSVAMAVAVAIAVMAAGCVSGRLKARDEAKFYETARWAEEQAAQVGRSAPRVAATQSGFSPRAQMLAPGLSA